MLKHASQAAVDTMQSEFQKTLDLLEYKLYQRILVASNEGKFSTTFDFNIDQDLREALTDRLKITGYKVTGKEITWQPE